MATKSGFGKLSYLRKLMMNVPDNDERQIQAYIITSDDAHQSEYIRERDKRRQYISGFKGSLGTAIVTQNSALLWTDGRYFTQASIELDPPDTWTLMKEGLIGTPSLDDWLISNLPSNSIVGADPNLISNLSWNSLQSSLKTAGHYLLPIEKNLIDLVWGYDRPYEILNKIVPHELIYSGKISGDKVKDCFQAMEKKKITILVLSALDEVAYLLNWRGSDIPYNPVFFAYVILFSNQVHIFIDEERITLDAKQQLIQENVNFILHPYDNIMPYLMQLCSLNDNNKVWISGNSSYALHRVCSSLPIHVGVTPISLMKLIKNDTEITGMKSAHVKDAIALVKYFSWLENKIVSKKNNDSIVTELSAANQLEKFRKYVFFHL
jgi:Xaa-Pro aminopeptidase